MIHTYSLIHDDLPCMDDDALRRGQPACHIKFGEAVALLAGDALLTLAFQTAADAPDLPDSAKRSAVSILSAHAGIKGMVGGQSVDLQNEKKHADLDTIWNMGLMKTGALIACACQLGCVAAGENELFLRIAKDFGERIGLAFQIIDDILDVTAASETLGKPAGSDGENQKSTYVTVLGINDSKYLAHDLTQKAVDAVAPFAERGENLITIALSLANRTK
jgi:geranylgeranyl diphosphate synthase type II